MAHVTVGTPVNVVAHAVHVGSNGAPAAQPEGLDRASQLEALAALGFPRGLAAQLASSAAVLPMRFFVLDNSGSMTTGDGHRVVLTSQGKQRVIGATRWEELVDSASTIAAISESLGARSDFHLLNRPGPIAQAFSICGGAGAASFVPTTGERVTAAALREQLRRVSPTGGTPLSESVMAIVSTLEPVAEELRARGQQAVVALLTDGVPNDPPTFALALQALQALPVWLVVRLCTDDDEIVSYWDELDQSLEAGLEVLDDDAGEAEEVAGKNRWLTYGAPLHAARTFGLSNKLFDLIDETTLLPSQTKAFVEMLLDCELPEPQVDLRAFLDAVGAALARTAPVYDPRRRRDRPWVDMKLLSKSVRPNKTGVCSMM